MSAFLARKWNHVFNQSELYKSFAVTLWEKACGNSCCQEATWGQLASKLSDFFLFFTKQNLEVEDLNYLRELYLGDKNPCDETIITRKDFEFKNMPRKLRISNSSERDENCKIFRWYYENVKLVWGKKPFA